MVERLLLLLALTLVATGGYTLLKRVHIRRISSSQDGAPGQPTLLYFWSKTCAACPTQARYLEQLAQRWHGRLAVRKINADTEPSKTAEYGIFSLPSTVIIDDEGTVREINYGVANVHKLQRQLEAL